MNLHIIHSTLKDSWALHPRAMERIKAFCYAYDSDIEHDILIDYLNISFVSKQPTALVLAATDDDGYMFGHCLCISEKWFGIPTVTVVQLEVDKGWKATPEMWRDGYKALKTFCWFHGAKFLQAAARNRAAARLFSRQGFEEKRILLRRPVEGRADKSQG